jgi:predicted nucleotidyltransferase
VQETGFIESNRKIRDKLIIYGINDQSCNYIKDIITLINKEIGINKILSIVLFGSQLSKNETSAISDCDLLIIFKNRVSNHHIKEIEKYFIALEIKHNFREFNDHLSKRILGVINQTTGIFISHFLTKRKYWEETIFHKIFRVNKVFSSVFAPRKIVLGNVLLNSSILYGEDLREKIKSKVQITIQEMFRSTVMNIMISLFSLVISFLKELNPTKYQLEAIKWALKASNYYCFRDSPNLNKITERFISFERKKSQKKAARFFSEFLELRKSPGNSMNFMIRCPIRIIKIHIKAILFKKLIKRKRRLIIPHKKIEPLIPDHTFPLRI